IDPVDSNHPTASGIYKLTVNSTAGPVAGSPFSYQGLADGKTGEDKPAPQSFTVADGTYTVQAFDGLGNKMVKSFVFIVDTVDPTESAAASGSNIQVNASDTGSGVSHVELFDGDGNYITTNFTSNFLPLANFQTQFTQLADGDYEVVAVDDAGNE